MKKLSLIGLFAGLLLLCGVNAHASTTASVIDTSRTDIHRDAFGTQYTAPYSDKDRSQESVSTVNGALNINHVDLTLPGKNGLDVVISRSFGNQSNQIVWTKGGGNGSYHSKLGPSYVYKANGQIFRIVFSSEEEMLHFAPEEFYSDADISKYRKTDEYKVEYYRYSSLPIRTEGDGVKYTRDKTAPAVTIGVEVDTWLEGSDGNVLGYEIGQNWRLNLPDMKTDYVKFLPDNPNIPYIGGKQRWASMRDYRGNIWTTISHLVYDEDTHIWSTDGFMSTRSSSTDSSVLEGEYVDITKEGKTENGINYNYVFTDMEGVKLYFKDSGHETSTFGRIQAIEDKYGNRITYTYGTDEAGEKKITITDTYGRDIYIRFQGNKAVRIEYPDPETNVYRTISYTETAVNNAQLDPGGLLSVDDDYRLAVTDADGNATVYRSQKTQTMYYEYMVERGFGFFEGDTSANSKAQAAYNLLDVTYPTGLKTVYTYDRWNYMLFYNVGGRGTRTRYVVTQRKDVSDGADHNVYTYDYYNQRDGMGEADMGDDYTFCGVTTRQQDQYQVVDTYNNKLDKVKIQTYLNGSYVNGRLGTPQETTELAYDRWTKSVSKQVVKRDSYVQTKEYKYYRAGKPTKVTEGDYVADMTYDGAYNMLLTTTYKQDADTTIVQENILTADKKSIDTSVVKVNGTVKAQTKFTYDQYGNVTSKQMWEGDTNGDGTLDGSDQTVTLKSDYTYNPDHSWSVHSYVENVGDADGNTTAEIGYTVQFDAVGNQKSVTDPNGNTTTYTFDVMNRPTKATFQDGTTRQLSYNISANEVTFTDENGTQTKSQFDPLGQIEQVLLNDAGWKTLERYEFNNIGQQVKKTTMRDDSSYTTEETTYNPDGTAASVRVKNAAGETVTGTDYTYTYAKTGKTISAQNMNDPVSKVETYDLRDRKVKEEAVTADQTLTSTYEYDFLENVISSRDPRANADVIGWGNTTETTYDYAGNVLTQKNALGNTLTNTYNMLGQLVSSTDYKGNATTYVYDKMGRNIQITAPFDGTNVSKKFSIYDKNGNVIREKQQNNAPGEGETYRVVEYEYNSKNKVTAVKQFDGETEYKTAYTYDNAGQQTALITGANTAAPHTTSYAYNKLGQVVSETDAMGGMKTAAYDLLGNITGGTSKAGEVITNTYNDWNLPVLQMVEGTDPNTGAARTDAKSFTYDNLGRKTSATNESGTATYEYDDFGRMVKETDVTGAIKEYTYDENGNRTSFKLTIDGTQQMNATYTYDRLNQLTSVTIGGDTTEYGYDANGNILNKTTGQLITEYAYNQGNMLTDLMTTRQGRDYPINEYTATYYLDGNRRTMWDSYEEDTLAYFYDGRGQIIREDHWFSNYFYEYDAYGNRSRRVGDSIETTYQYNANNQLLLEVMEDQFSDNINQALKTITRYTYDTNGNMVSKVAEEFKKSGSVESAQIGVLGESTPAAGSAARYTYNGFGERTGALVDGKTAQYSYNPDGLRVSKTLNGETTTHILDGSNVVADVKGGSLVKFNRGRGLISIEQNGNKGYYAFNMHGDVDALLEGTSQVASSRIYGVYGDLLRGEEKYGQFDNPFGYSGEYTDAETGDIYLRARYYDPNTGRFVSEDPIKDGTNWYVYGANNPVLFVDPSGKEVYLSGSREEMETQLRTMQILTADWLNVDWDTGKVWIEYEKSDGDRTTGTNMLRRLITRTDHKTTIQSRYGSDRESRNNTKYSNPDAASMRGVGSDSVITFNNQVLPTLLVKNKDGSISKEVAPDYITLGHELIHALRAMDGNRKGDTAQYRIDYTDVNGQPGYEEVFAEELETSGISYTNAEGYNVNAWWWDTTENTLRDEQGLRRRVKYGEA